MDHLTPTARSAHMRRIKGKRTGPERRLEAALARRGVAGWVRHPADLPGKPDLAFRGSRVAVQVHGCFWHGCPLHYRAPKSSFKYPAGWWEAKVRRNRARDRLQAARLRADGWRLVVAWEHESARSAAERVVRALARRPS